MYNFATRKLHQELILINGAKKKVTRLDGTEERHHRRIWDGVKTIEEIYEAFQSSPHYQSHLQLHPSATIAKTIFKKYLCPCVQQPKSESCVDETKAAVDEIVAGFRKVFLFDEQMKDDLRNCKQLPTLLYADKVPFLASSRTSGSSSYLNPQHLSAC